MPPGVVASEGVQVRNMLRFIYTKDHQLRVSVSCTFSECHGDAAIVQVSFHIFPPTLGPLSVPPAVSGMLCQVCTPGAIAVQLQQPTVASMWLVAATALGRQDCGVWNASIRRRELGASWHHCRWDGGPKVFTALTPKKDHQMSQIPRHSLAVIPDLDPTPPPAAFCSRLSRLGLVQVPRWGAAAVQAGGSVCVFGGRGAATTALSSVERFDPATGTWEPLPPLKVPRKSGDPGWHFRHLPTTWKICRL